MFNECGFVRFIGAVFKNNTKMTPLASKTTSGLLNRTSNRTIYWLATLLGCVNNKKFKVKFQKATILRLLLVWNFFPTTMTSQNWQVKTIETYSCGRKREKLREKPPMETTVWVIYP